MKKQSMIVVLVILLLFGSVSAQYNFEPLNFNAGCKNPAFGICSFARGVNNRGDIVGWGSSGVLGAEGSEVGFLLDGKSGSVTILEYPGATKTRASGINDRGDIVGQYLSPPSFHEALHAFLRKKDGTWQDISPPGAASSNAWGINARGEVVGEYSLPSDGPGVAHGFVRSPQVST